MLSALALADKAAAADEVPVGAVVVVDDAIVGLGYNQTRTLCDPTAHAEVMALRDAAMSLNDYRLVDATVYVTIEPCLMCCGALQHARVKRLVFGAREPKTGSVVSVFDSLMDASAQHRVAITEGVLEDQCRSRIQQFFEARR